MKKEEVLKYIETKGDESYIVRTEAEEKTFLENLSKQIEEEKVNPEIARYFKEIDDDLFKITGLRRVTQNENGEWLPAAQREKTTDFLKRVFESHKSKAEKADAYEKEITNLKKQIAEGTNDKKVLADLEAVQKAYKELEDKSKGEVDTLKKTAEQKEIRYEITTALSGYAYKKGITEPVRKAFIDQVINELVGVAELRDGKLLFIDKAGNPMRNAHNSLNPYTAKELLDERLKEIIDVGRKIDGGPGIEGEVTKEYDKGGKLTKINLLLPDTVRTKQDLSNFLVSQKLLRGSQEYDAAYAEYSPSLPRA